MASREGLVAGPCTEATRVTDLRERAETMEAERTVADVVAARLWRAGCRHAFGIPGGEVVVLIDALVRAGIRFHLVRHETAGGFMAEGTYYASGAPAVLVATLGPGVANAVNAIANASQERVPMLFLTGCVDEDIAAGYTHQVFDHQAVLAPLVKGTFRLAPRSAPILVDKAIRVACAERPGPVHLELPVALAKSPSSPAVSTPTPALGRPTEPALAAAAEKVADSERPLILAGFDAVRADAHEPIRRLSRALDAPVVTTYKGKGLVDESDRSSLGAAGLSPAADRLIQPLVASADAVVLAGYDPIEMRQPWRDPFDEAAAVVDLTPVIPDHYVHRATDVLVGDVAASVTALSEAVESRPRIGRWPDGQPESVRRALGDLFADREEEWGPRAVCSVLADAIPADAYLSVDTGAHRILLSQVWRTSGPNRLLQSSGLASMGPAVPYAVGAKLADPDRVSVAVVGDGGLEMILGELATLRDLELAVPIVVFDDRALALIEIKQRRAGLPAQGVLSGGTDFVSVAQAMGGAAWVAEDRRTLRTALDESLNATRFSLIHCVLPRAAYDRWL